MSTSFNGDTSPQPPPRPQVPQPLELQENYKDRQLPLLPQQGDDSVSKHEKGETFLTFDLLTQSEGGGRVRFHPAFSMFTLYYAERLQARTLTKNI